MTKNKISPEVKVVQRLTNCLVFEFRPPSAIFGGFLSLEVDSMSLSTHSRNKIHHQSNISHSQEDNVRY
jgi:hypothetical protein